MSLRFIFGVFHSCCYEKWKKKRKQNLLNILKTVVVIIYIHIKIEQNKIASASVVTCGRNKNHLIQNVNFFSLQIGRKNCKNNDEKENNKGKTWFIDCRVQKIVRPLWFVCKKNSVHSKAVQHNALTSTVRKIKWCDNQNQTNRMPNGKKASPFSRTSSASIQCLFPAYCDAW